jgi:hypothetical protein
MNFCQSEKFFSLRLRGITMSVGSRAHVRKFLWLLSSAVMVSSTLVIASFVPEADVADAAKPTRATKFEICHRTNALKNPYRRINVAWGATSAHAGHTGIVFSTANPEGVHGTAVSRKLSGDAGYSEGTGTPLSGGNARWGDIFFCTQECRSVARVELGRRWPAHLQRRHVYVSWRYEAGVPNNDDE